MHYKCQIRLTLNKLNILNNFSVGEYSDGTKLVLSRCSNLFIVSLMFFPGKFNFNLIKDQLGFESQKVPVKTYYFYC